MATNLRPENEYPTLKPGMVYDPEVDYPTQPAAQTQGNPFNPAITNWQPTGQTATQSSADSYFGPSTSATPTAIPRTQQSTNNGTNTLYTPGQGQGLLGGTRTIEGNPNASVQTGNQGLQTATNATAGYREVDPIYRSIHAPTETMQGQLASIIDPNMPLMARARARANAEMQKRGLLSSSIAVGAAEGALYDVALPIAQNDSAAYLGASRDNQAVGNQTQQFNASNYNQNQQFNVGQTNDTTRFNAGQGNNLNLTNIQESGMNSRLAISEAGQDRRQSASLSAQRDIAAMGHANAALIQSSANASAVFQQAQADITNIQMDPNLTAEGKDRAIAQHMSFLEQGLIMAGRASNVDFGATLDFRNSTPQTSGGEQSGATIKPETGNTGGGGGGGDGGGSYGGGYGIPGWNTGD